MRQDDSILLLRTEAVRPHSEAEAAETSERLQCDSSDVISAFSFVLRCF